MPFDPETDPYIRQAAIYFKRWLEHPNGQPLDEFSTSMRESFSDSQATIDFALKIAA